MIALMGEDDGMKRRHHTPEQIVRKLREADQLLGRGILKWWAVCKHLEVTEQRYHRWRNQYGGMKAVVGGPRSIQGKSALFPGMQEQHSPFQLRLLAGVNPRYGYRRLYALLFRQGYQLNHKRLQRLCRDEGLRGEDPKT
jgi:hypothetical protein